MKLGFVSAILPDLSLEEVFDVANNIGYDCVEVMCWPKGKAERRYAGITHIDIHTLDDSRINEINELQSSSGVSISALGYYPNPLVNDVEASTRYKNHIIELIDAAVSLDINTITTFVGRDHTKSVDDNWPRFLATWGEILQKADENNIKIGIENCPMSFTADEWPGGLNLATTPAIWDRMYEAFPTSNFGLNFDPSHYIIQHMDYTETIASYAERFHHVHAKDARIDRAELNRCGVFSHPNLWHTPKLPGMGDVDWSRFFGALTSAGYKGAVCVEVEDRAYEGSLEDRIRALQQSYNYLRQWVV